MISCVLVCAAVGFAAQFASAAPYSWTGLGGDALWSNVNNWSPVGLPGAADDVTIPAGATAVTITTANVTVQSLDLQRSLSVGTGRTLTVGTANVNGGIALVGSGTLSGGIYTFGVSGNIIFPARCNFGRLNNVTINGDIAGFSGGMRWNNVTLNGTLTATGAGTSEIVFEGSQTLTGTIASNVSGSGSLVLTSNAAGTLTIAAGAKIQGGNIDFNRSSPCLSGGNMTVVNNGTIEANIAGRTIDFNTSSAVALTNSSTGVINISGGTLSLSTLNGSAGTINFTSGGLNMGGASPLQLGTFNRSGGTATINGVADLGGATWNVPGAWTFTGGGTVQNGTINLAAGSFAFPARCSFGRLSNVTINGNLPNFTGGLRWNNVTLNGTLTATGTGTSEIVFEGAQTLTGTIVSNVSGSAALLLSANAAGALTIAAGAKVQGGNIDFLASSSCLSGGSMTVINNGTIDANVAGRAIDFNTSSAVSLTNNGTINITTGTLSVRGFTGNAGTINFSGGVLNFGGTLTALGTFNRSGGTANIIGTAELANTTWSPNGTWNFISGAAVQNGTIDLSSGNLVFPARCSFGRLSNVVLQGDITSFTGGLRWNNVTLNGTLTATGTGTSEIVFEGAQTLTGTVVSNVSSSGSLILSTNAAGALTIAAGAKVQGGNIDFLASSSCLGGGSMTVINNGTIDANVAGRTIDFSNGVGVPLTNNGTVNITTGTFSVRGFTGTAGTMNFSGGVLNFTGTLGNLGTFNRSGGTANLIGTNEVGASPWTPNGVWTLASGAVVQNGTINITTGGLTFPARCAFGRLSNITLNGNLPSFTGGLRWNNVTLNGTITATGTGTHEIVFEGTQTLTGTITSNLSGSGSLYLSNNGPGTLTIASGAKVQGGNIDFQRSSSCLGSGNMTIVNNGTIDANVAGRTIDFTSSPISLTNNGSLLASAGNVVLSSGTNNGLFKISPGSSISVSSGALALGATSTLEIELKGPPPSTANFGRLTSSNNAASAIALNGTLKIRNVAAYTPTCGLEWNIVSSALLAAGTPITGTFSTFDFPFPGEGNLQRVTYEPKKVSFFIATQADFNEDGFITFEDFDEFVSSFEAGEGRSDFNADGFLTFEDFDAFVSKFEGGC